jgi:hypothetical protein
MKRDGVPPPLIQRVGGISMYKMIITFLATSAVLSIMGCASQQATVQQATVPHDNQLRILAPFYLQIVNTWDSPVEISVEIDGDVVAHDAFSGSRTMMLMIPTGKHKLKVSSTKGNAELLQDFETEGSHVLSIVYMSEPASNGEPRRGKFVVKSKATTQSL